MRSSTMKATTITTKRYLINVTKKSINYLRITSTAGLQYSIAKVHGKFRILFVSVSFEKLNCIQRVSVLHCVKSQHSFTRFSSFLSYHSVYLLDLRHLTKFFLQCPRQLIDLVVSNFEYLFWFFSLRLSVINNNKYLIFKIQNLPCLNWWAADDIIHQQLFLKNSFQRWTLIWPLLDIFWW